MLWSTGFIGAKFGLPVAKPLTFLNFRCANVRVLLGHALDLRSGSVVQFLPSLLLTQLVASQTETLQGHRSGAFVFVLAWLVLVLSLGAVSLLD